VQPKIGISADLHVVLQGLKEPDDRTIEDVIWKLLADRQITRPDNPARLTGYVLSAGEGVHTGNGTIPNGLRLRGRYKAVEHTYAEVRDGRIWIGSESFSSPSAAAGAVARNSGAGWRAASINGWSFWEFEFPKGSSRWRRLNSLRWPWEIQRRRY